MATAGDNSDKLLKDCARRIAALMDEIKDLREDVKKEVAAAKLQGLDPRALLRVVREMGMDEDQRAKQLAFEFVVDDYRRAVGLTPAAAEREAA